MTNRRLGAEGGQPGNKHGERIRHRRHDDVAQLGLLDLEGVRREVALASCGAGIGTANWGLAYAEVLGIATKFDSWQPRMNYTLITQVDCLGPLIGSLVCADVVALDTETTGLNPRRDHVRLLQLATNDGCWLIDLYEVNPAYLWPYLAGKTIVMHNSVFDLCFLATLGFEPTVVVDTMLASQVCYAGHWVAGEIAKATSLKECALRELGVELDKELQTSDWGGELTPEMLAYAARDAAVLLPLWSALEQSLLKEGLRDVAELEFRAVRAVAWASYVGVGFDAARWTALCEEARKEAEGLVPQLGAHVPESYRRTTHNPINWNSRKESLEALRAAGVHHIPNANDKSLAGFPLGRRVLAWRRARKDGREGDMAEFAKVLNALLPVSYLAQREPAVNWHSTQQKAAILQELGVQLPRTAKGSPRVDDDTLAGIDHPLAALLRKYSDAVKRAERVSWLEFADDGRIYPSWHQCGTETGRMSASKPPMQQVNRTAGHRSCFVAPPGRVLVKADYSQIELRVAAVISGDPVMLGAYQNGEDLHTKTALMLLCRSRFDDDEEKKKARQLAKACNFGLLYGMGAKKLGLYSRVNYGVEMSDDEAAYYHRVFFDTYRGLRRWQRRAGDDGSWAAYTRSGRRRVLVQRKEEESFFTRRLNTPVQGTAGDGLKAAAALLYERRVECPDAVLVLFVHDELVLECNEATRETTEAWLQQAMIDGMQPLIDPVQVVVETDWGYDWGCSKVRRG